MVVARDVELRGRLARLLHGAGYSVELAENRAHARRIGLKGFVVAIIAPQKLGPEAQVLQKELMAVTRRTLCIAEPGMGAEPGAGLLDPSDETGLLAEIAEALQPSPESEPGEQVLRFSGFRLDFGAHSMTNEAGQEIPLTRGELNLLREFVQRPGRVLTRDQLLRALVGRDAESYDRSIDMLMVRLRRKIEPDPKRPSLIVTIPGSGYKFTAKVTSQTVSAAAKEQEAQQVSAAPSPSPLATPERRQLTILHCALSGPAFLAAQRDPEELHRLLTTFCGNAAEIITKAGGTVARFLSEGLLARFGYPQAHEDDAEQAVRAGLALIEMAGRVQSPEPLQVSIGVATGLVVIASLSGSGAAAEQTAVGETPHLAARLQGLAEPNALVIAESTRRLIGTRFETAPLGPEELKGLGEAQNAWRVVSENRGLGRFEALRGRNLADLVGREEELALLLRRWDQAKSGEGRVVLLTGESGIGKSRIVAALLDRLAAERHARLRHFCSPRHSDSALYPIATELERTAGFQRGDQDRTKLAKLEELLRKSKATQEQLGLIAGLLSIPTDTRYALADMSPQKRKEKVFEALWAQLVGLASQRPVVILYEDVHWIDPTSLELLSLTVERVPGLPVLLVITARPEFKPPWPDQAHVTSHAMTRLSRREASHLIANVTGGKALPAEVMQQILTHTDGVPLFVEELTKAVLEAGRLRQTDAGYELTGSLSSFAIPTTLHDSLMARLDRLSTAREIAQIGAALGREFSYATLSAIAAIPEEQLRIALRDLVRSELVFCRGEPPEAIYTFKHALVQDTAYQSMLKSQRSQLHGRIAETLQSSFPELVQAKPETLAQHFAAAERPERAIPYWLRAGQLASERGANQEAVNHLKAGIELLPKVAGQAARVKFEIDLQTALGFTLIAVKGYAASEVETAFSRAYELSQGTPDANRTLRGLTLVNWGRGDLVTASRFGRQLVEIAEQASDVELRLVANGMLSGILYYMGQLSASEVHLQRLQVPYDLQQRQSIVARFGEDTPSTTWCFHAFNLGWMGDLDRAVAAAREAVDSARRTGHPYSVAHALCRAAMCHVILRDLSEASALADQAKAIAHDLGFPIPLAVANVVLGWASALGGKADEGIDRLRDGIAIWQSTGGTTMLPFYFTLLSEAMLAGGDMSAAIATADEALQWRTELAEHAWDCLLYCARGDALVASGEFARAEADYELALAWSRERGARWGELYAGIRLARLWQSDGRAQDARKLLTPIRGWFAKDLDTPVLKEATSLLKQLASAPEQEHRHRAGDRSMARLSHSRMR